MKVLRNSKTKVIRGGIDSSTSSMEFRFEKGTGQPEASE